MPVTIRGKVYEDVKERIAVFYERYEDGRIVTEVLSEGENHVTIRASIFSNQEEQFNNTPLATGIAREERGGEIEKYTENAETSAIGRAFANRNVYGVIAQESGTRPSAEEMVNVSDAPPAPKKFDGVLNEGMRERLEKVETERTTTQANVPPPGSYKTGEVASAEAFGEKPVRLCPKCQIPMREQARRSDGGKFLGCPNFSNVDIKCGETANV